MKRNMLKKLMVLTLGASILSGTLVGCGQATDKDAAVDKNTTTSGEVVETSGSGEISGKLKMAVFQGGYGPEYWNEMVDRFEAKYPDVEVELEISPKIGEMIRPRIISGDVPDFIYLSDTQQDGLTLGLIKDKGLMDLTDLFEEMAMDKDVKLKDYILPGMLESPKFSPYGDGKVYLAPFSTAPAGMIYNKTLFEEKGWEVPSTWDEFFALGDVAKAEGRSLYTVTGLYPGYNNSMVLPAIASHAGMDALYDVFNYEEGSFASPEVMNVLNQLNKISAEGYMMPGSMGMNHTQTQSEMMLGKSVFISCGTWIANEMKDAPREGEEKFEFALLPGLKMNEEETTYITTTAEQMYIPANAKNPEAAKEFIKFIYTDESVKLFAEKAGGLVAVKDAVNLIEGIVDPSMHSMLSIYADPDAKVFVQGYKAPPAGSKFDVIGELYGKGIVPLYNGEITPQQWSQQVEKAFASVRAEY